MNRKLKGFSYTLGWIRLPDGSVWIPQDQMDKWIYREMDIMRRIRKIMEWI